MNEALSLDNAPPVLFIVSFLRRDGEVERFPEKISFALLIYMKK